MLRWIAGIMLLLLVSAGIYAGSILFKPFSLTETVYIYIDGQKKYEDVMTQLKEKNKEKGDPIAGQAAGSSPGGFAGKGTGSMK